MACTLQVEELATAHALQAPQPAQLSFPTCTIGPPPPLGFPHTMLSVERVKDNMQLAFIEKLFTNRAIKTNMQTRYLRFKGMSYESENYLYDINYVQS
jgi:hypothetical protein